MSTQELNDKIQAAYREFSASVELPGDIEPPANEIDISLAEANIGMAVPVEFRIALELFNGTNALVQLPLGVELEPAHFAGISPVQEWAVVSGQAREELSFWIDDFKRGLATVVGPVKPVPFHDEWIMISYGYGFYWFLDFCPELGGTLGQIVVVYPMPDEHRVQVVAPNFLVFLRLMTDALKKNKQG